MKLLLLLIGTLFIPTVFSFAPKCNIYNKQKFNINMLNKDTANEALKYKNILRETTYNSLISKIKKHDIDKVFITNKLDNVISEDINSEGDILTDYSITKINQAVVKSIVDESINNNVETYFLQEGFL